MPRDDSMVLPELSIPWHLKLKFCNMAIFKPFKAYRPTAKLAGKIASRPYDVLSSQEAREEADGNPYSFLHVIKPEIDLPSNIDVHSEMVYEKAKSNLQKLLINHYKQDDNPKFYVYAQTMQGKTQYGLVGCTSVQDYFNDIIKKHELTRPDKEDDRKNHVRVTGFNAEPVFFSYPDHKGVDQIVSDVVINDVVYDFVAEDGIRHMLWLIDDPGQVKQVEKYFEEEIPYVYVADGHHRTAAAARVGEEMRNSNPGHNGNEEYNFFMSVLFPASQLTIIDYNRVVKDLNGLSQPDFIVKLNQYFLVKENGDIPTKPARLHEFTMYLENKWYTLEVKEGLVDENDPIGSLDVTILSKYILDPMLDIKDLRKSDRIDFVGGIRGIGELKKRVDSGEMKVAFALYPVSMDQLIKIADTGNIMPPKTTWFEPKLRSGLFLHDLEID